MLSVTVRLAAVLLGILGTSAWGQKLETLYSFPSDGTAGRRPVAALTLGSDGKLYGTTEAGGAFDVGAVFRIETNGNFELLGSFNPSTTGRYPQSPLLHINGYMYGVTFSGGGAAGGGAGAVYRLDPSATPSGVEGSLTSFFKIPSSGNTTPQDGRWLTMGDPDALHVMCKDYAGIWRVPLNGSVPEVAYFFGDAKVDGYFGYTLTRGNDGFLYGTTIGKYRRTDGVDVHGTLFRIAPDGSGMTRLHEMLPDEGSLPKAALTQGPDGYLYGVAAEGGEGRGDGSFFRISPTGDDFRVIHHFQDLRYPHGELLFAADGYFYGTANYGGDHAYGGIFRIRPNGSGYKLIHSFSGKDGANSDAGLVLGPDGNLYGTSSRGGAQSEGAIFRIIVKLPPPTENRAPVALNDFAYTTAGVAVDIDVRANDYDPDDDALSLSITAAPEHGTVVPQPGGLLRYTPGVAYDGTDQFTYKISDGRGGESSAVVQIRNIASGPLVQAGAYNGLLMEDSELTFEGEMPRGQFTLKVSDSGRFTGTLLGGRKRFALRGEFNEQGVALVQVKITKKISLPLLLSFQAGEPNGIAAVLFGGTEALTGVAGRVITEGSGQRATATLALEADDPIAVGYGYGVISILPNGNFLVKGKLGDGTKLSWGTNVVMLPDGSVVAPVFNEPLPGGVCGGYLASAGLGVGGQLQWFRPPVGGANKAVKPYSEGISTTLSVSGETFTTPEKTEPVLAIPGGEIDANGGSATGEFTLDGKKVSVSQPLRSLSFNRSTGLFSGKIVVENKTVSFEGVVLQQSRRGYGQYNIGGQVRTVELFPEESIK